MRRRLEFEASPGNFARRYREETAALRGKIREARALLPRVKITRNALQLAVSFAAQVRAAGHRGEMALIQTAAAIAALDRRVSLTLEDIRIAAEYALPHRIREEDPTAAVFEESPRDTEAGETEPREPPPETKSGETRSEEAPENEAEQAGEYPGDAPEDGALWQDRNQGGADGDLDLQEAAELFDLKQWKEAPGKQKANSGAGRRKSAASKNRQGRYVRWLWG